MKKWLRTFVGLFLISASVIGIFYWEIDGRERLLTDKILVASADILPGTIMSSNLINEVGISKELIVADVVDKKAISKIIGKTAKQYIPKNAQLSESYFGNNYLILKPDESTFVIRANWIDMVSSAVRAGDRIAIFSKKENILLDEFYVAFVKDSAFREVKTVSEKETDTSTLNRIDSNSFVSYIEIIGTLAQYKVISNYIDMDPDNKLVIVLLNSSNED